MVVRPLTRGAVEILSLRILEQPQRLISARRSLPRYGRPPLRVDLPRVSLVEIRPQAVLFLRVGLPALILAEEHRTPVEVVILVSHHVVEDLKAIGRPVERLGVERAVAAF